MTQYFKDFELNLDKMIFRESDSEHILQLNYVYLISCMETYLSTAMWGTLEQYPEYYNNLGKEIKKSVKFSTIFHKGIPESIQEELSDFQYHRLAQLRIYYKTTFNVTFPEILSSLYKAIEIRHDIVHRCGVSKKNIPTSINFQSVETLKMNITKFIKDIDNQMQKI